MNPFHVVQIFEEELARYTGAKYAVTVSSCTDALFLSCMYHNVKDKEVVIPKRTYLSVPQSIIHAGGIVKFNDYEWQTHLWSRYQLSPFPIWDAAKELQPNMYRPSQTICLSFHIKKPLGIGKGGCILTDDKDMVDWLKKARYEGRSEKSYHEDDITFLGWNMYMTPEQAARGLVLLSQLPKDGIIQHEKYRDLTEFTLFKNVEVIHSISLLQQEKH
jgi:dTDP-4-amino-4,6-dideoxygalactose transaminase